MGLFSFRHEVDATQDMAKRQNIDVNSVDAYVKRLIECGTDKSAFDRAFSAVQADDALNVSEIQAIAVGYSGGGKKPSNRKAAISAIAVRFAEIVGFHRKNAIAAKARPL
jgi:hypothetical protein